MGITQQLESTPLTRACAEIRRILSSNSYLQSVLTDTLRPTEPIIKSVPLNYKTIVRDAQVSVYHTMHKQIISEKSGVIITQAPIFIDIFKKLNQKDYVSIFDELEKFSLTVVGILYDADPTKKLNGEVTDWMMLSQSPWKEQKNETVKIQEEKLFDYISQITLVIEYSTIFRRDF